MPFRYSIIIFVKNKFTMPHKINISEENNTLTIIINAFYDEKKQQLLFLWIVLFSICGIAIFSQFFVDYPMETKLFFGVYLAFWLFFEFKVIYAFRWRKYGSEIFTIEENNIILSKKIGNRGITETYPIEDVKNFQLIKYKDNFVHAINSNYWSINKYTISFDFNNQTIPFGIELNENQAKNIIHTINNFVKKSVEKNN